MPRLLCYYWAAHLSQHPTLGEAHLGQPAHCFHICESTAHLTRETQLTQAQPNTQLPNQQKEFTSRKWLKVCREVPRGKVDCARCFSWGWGGKHTSHHGARFVANMFDVADWMTQFRSAVLFALWRDQPARTSWLSSLGRNLPKMHQHTHS